MFLADNQLELYAMKLSIFLLAFIASCAAECSTDNIPENQKRQYDAIFKKLDTDGSGYIDPNDLKITQLSNGLGGYLGSMGQQAASVATAGVLGKLSKLGEHSVSECEFVSQMYQSQMASMGIFGKINQIAQQAQNIFGGFTGGSGGSEPVVVHG